MIGEWLRAVVSLTRGAARVDVEALARYSERHTWQPSVALTPLIERAMGEAAVERPRLALFTGTLAVGWTLALLERTTWGGIEVGDGLSGFDDLAETVVRASGRVPYGLRAGAIGAGVYLLARAAGDLASLAWVSLLVDRVEGSATFCRDGVALFTEPAWLSPLAGATHPRGRHELGMADGVSGAVAFFAALVARGWREERTTELLEGMVSWLVAQVERHRSFPAWVDADGQAGPSTLGWCMGGAGVVAAVFQAGSALARPTWREWAVDRAVEQLSAPAGTEAADSLCHGAAGVAHTLNRLFHATGDPRLRRAARAWLDRLVSSFVEDPGGVPSPTPLSFQGRLGAAFAILAAGSERPPIWDQRLLLS